jgi:uncharacterized membrane protein
MGSIQQTIEVEVPVHAAYEQLTDFESYPAFMTGVRQVKQLSTDKTHWIMDVGGQRREFDAKVTAQQRDRCVAWQATDGAIQLAETITLQSISPGRTQIIAELDTDADDLLPNAKNPQDALSGQLLADLGQFKEFMEQQLGPDPLGG